MENIDTALMQVIEELKSIIRGLPGRELAKERHSDVLRFLPVAAILTPENSGMRCTFSAAPPRPGKPRIDEPSPLGDETLQFDFNGAQWCDASLVPQCPRQVAEKIHKKLEEYRKEYLSAGNDPGYRAGLLSEK